MHVLFLLQYAVGLGRPIMNRDWLKRLWSERDTPDYRADDPNVVGDLFYVKSDSCGFHISR